MESVELYLQLSCKCVPSMLIIATGDSPETAAPRFVEVHAGEVLGRMTCLLRSTAIPRAWPGAHLIYSLGNDDLPSRFLVVTFTGLEAADADRETLALSPVEVLSKAGKLALSHCRGLVSGESDDDIPLDEFWPAPIAGVHARGTDGGDASCQLLRSLQPHNDSSDWDAQAGPESVSVKGALLFLSSFFFLSRQYTLFLSSQKGVHFSFFPSLLLLPQSFPCAPACSWLANEEHCSPDAIRCRGRRARACRGDAQCPCVRTGNPGQKERGGTVFDNVFLRLER